jgi:hypothetical protein
MYATTSHVTKGSKILHTKMGNYNEITDWATNLHYSPHNVHYEGYIMYNDIIYVQFLLIMIL